MLHRVKKEHDLNKDKWIGVGGKFEEKESPEEWFEKLFRFFDADHVMIMKKTKKGEREMDLKPFVYELNVRKNG